MIMARAGMRVVCKHCGGPKANRPRGLCYWCYHDPEIRAEYPKQSTSSNHRGFGNEQVAKPLPAEATDEVPGTEAKIDVMAARAEAGFQIFHPEDAVVNEDDVLVTVYVGPMAFYRHQHIRVVDRPRQGGRHNK